MTNAPDLPSRSHSKSAAPPDETILANLQKEGDATSHCQCLLSLKPVTDFYTNDPLAKIEAGVASNRELLNRLPPKGRWRSSPRSPA